MSAALRNKAASPTAITNFPSAPPADETNGKINALLAENAEFERRRALYRDPREELDTFLMTSPQTTAQSYGTLGLLLGAFPPAAYFTRIVHYGLVQSESIGLFLFLLLINAVCILVGWKIGKMIGNRMELVERSSWNKMIVFSLLWAIFWAVVTGFAGGAVVLIIGGFFGVIFALPVALAAFPAFAVIHRLLERGHLIEKKHLLPAAYGISLAISAFILGYR
jgi:hypothetical protein